MQEMLNSAGGPVARHLMERATRVQVAAIQEAPYKTGVLKRSIVKRGIEDVGGRLAIRIVADTTSASATRTSYALYVHEGTQPHVIIGKPFLSFMWANGPNGFGRYFFRSVNHPGTPARRFLTNNLYLAVSP
jgi:hypothetical protein